MSVRIEDAFNTHFATTLRRHVGRGRRWSADALAMESGLSESMVRQLMSGQRTPQGYTVALFYQILGTPFVNDMLAFSGHRGARPMQNSQACPDAVLAKATKAAANLAGFNADRVICKSEHHRNWSAFEEVASMSADMRVGAI